MRFAVLGLGEAGSLFASDLATAGHAVSAYDPREVPTPDGIVRCDDVVKNESGEIVELRGTLDLESRPGMPGADRKIKGTIHWVSAQHAVPAEVRLYDRLFTVANPDNSGDTDAEGKTYRDYLNPESRRSVRGYVEPAAASAGPEQSFQFERIGYFVADRFDHRADAPVFNRSVTLRDTWAANV